MLGLYRLYLKLYEIKRKLIDAEIRINSNGYSIDVHLIAHLYELLGVLEKAYSNYFSEHSDLLCTLTDYKTEIIDILEEHYEHGYINVLAAPELKRIEVSKNP